MMQNAPRYMSRRTRSIRLLTATAAAGLFVPCWTETSVVAGTVTIQSGSFVEIGVSWGSSGGSDLASTLSALTFPDPLGSHSVSKSYVPGNFDFNPDTQQGFHPRTVTTSAQYVMSVTGFSVSAQSLLPPTATSDVAPNMSTGRGSVIFTADSGSSVLLGGGITAPNFDENDPLVDSFGYEYSMSLWDITDSLNPVELYYYNSLDDFLLEGPGASFANLLVSGRTYEWSYDFRITLTGGVDLSAVTNLETSIELSIAFVSDGPLPVPLPSAFLAGLGGLSVLTLGRRHARRAQ